MMALKCLSLCVLVLLISATGFIDAVPSGYTYINSTHAYYKYIMETVTWAVAVSTCQSEDARLFHPDSSEELKLVWRELHIGDNGRRHFHTGLSDKDRPNEYKTVDGRPISQVYNEWSSGEPRSCGHTLCCGYIGDLVFTLEAGSCDSTRRFVCKHEKEVTATDVTTVTADSFSSGYAYINSTHAYYKLYREAATWADAAATCRSKGERLFHPDSAEELELVWRELNVEDIGGWGIHTGLSYLDNLQEYKTVDGRPRSKVFNKWEQGKPNSGKNNKLRCGVLDVASHLLFLYNCYYTRRFICKHDEEVTATVVTTVTADFELLKQEVASMHLQAANQTAAMDILKQEVASIHLQAANQTRALERIAEADANQAASLDRLIEIIQSHAANQTAAVERQALAMERFAGPQEQ